MEKNEIVRMLVVVVVAAFFGAILVSGYFLFQASRVEGDGRFPSDPIGGGGECTLDARLCSDGSSVSRTGPKCEFAPCPGEGSEEDLPGKGVPNASSSCVDRCGDGTCEEVVCMGSGCPCVENETICPSDCSSSAGNDVLKRACPEDAKVCPDGSTVIRIGPNCEFAPCS